MDRTIHYFQDTSRTDVWIVRSTISRILLVGLNMDRTIHYFQDRLLLGLIYGSYNPLFPGSQEDCGKKSAAVKIHLHSAAEGHHLRLKICAGEMLTTRG